MKTVAISTDAHAQLVQLAAQLTQQYGYKVSLGQAFELAVVLANAAPPENVAAVGDSDGH